MLDMIPVKLTTLIRVILIRWGLGSASDGDVLTYDATEGKPIFSTPVTSGVETIVAGSGISIDDTDPANPVVSVDGVVSPTKVVLESPVSTAGTSAVSVPGFSIAMEANSLYQVWTYFEGGANEGLVQATAPIDASYSLGWGSSVLQNDLVSGNSTPSFAPIPDAGGYNVIGITLAGYVKSVTAGNLQFKVKRSGGSDFTLAVGSVLMYSKVN